YLVRITFSYIETKSTELKQDRGLPRLQCESDCALASDHSFAEFYGIDFSKKQRSRCNGKAMLGR
ncbi:unnamed protein product, partial [Brassica oleracea]